MKDVHDIIIRPHITEKSLSQSYGDKRVTDLKEVQRKYTFVVATDAGYHVLLLHRFQAAGTRADLDYVREEIRNRVLIEQRRVRYRSLLAEIRQRHRVEIRAVAPGK